jgi:hypothetical protein
VFVIGWGGDFDVSATTCRKFLSAIKEFSHGHMTRELKQKTSSSSLKDNSWSRPPIYHFPQTMHYHNSKQTFDSFKHYLSEHEKLPHAEQGRKTMKLLHNL